MLEIVDLLLSTGPHARIPRKRTPLTSGMFNRSDGDDGRTPWGGWIVYCRIPIIVVRNLGQIFCHNVLHGISQVRREVSERVKHGSVIWTCTIQRKMHVIPRATSSARRRPDHISVTLCSLFKRKRTRGTEGKGVPSAGDAAPRGRLGTLVCDGVGDWDSSLVPCFSFVPSTPLSFRKSMGRVGRKNPLTLVSFRERATRWGGIRSPICPALSNFTGLPSNGEPVRFTPGFIALLLAKDGAG
jgi:hypothetical protein